MVVLKRTLAGKEPSALFLMLPAGAPFRRTGSKDMVRKTIAAAAAAMMVASPALAAELPVLRDDGARRSGAVASLYLNVPLGGGARAEAPFGGLKLSMVHDY